jgi:hypothetical protein
MGGREILKAQGDTMHSVRFAAIAVVSGVLTGISGCVPLSPDTPLVIHELQMVSAGHTGCLPAENEISQNNYNLNGSGTWNATCKGKVYLCSAVSLSGGGLFFSCAPAAR